LHAGGRKRGRAREFSPFLHVLCFELCLCLYPTLHAHDRVCTRCVCVCLCACMCLHVSQIRPASCKFEGRICMQALKLRELGCVFFVYLELSRQMLHNQSMHLKCINWLLWKRSLVFFNLSRHPFALVTLHFLLL